MIRPYRPEDLEALLDVWYEASLIAHPFLDEAFLQKERIKIRDVYTPMTETWVYEEEGHVVGFISLIEIEVGAIFVYPSHQGKGIGRALMDKARSIRPTLELDVFKANPIGRAFYERYGFVFVREGLHEETGQPILRLRLPEP